MDFWSAIIGGAFACMGAVLGVWLSARKERQLRLDEEQQEVTNYRKALRSEIHILWENYMWGIGNSLEQHPNGTPFPMYYPVYEKYFGVYDDNMGTLSKISDDEERTQIIKTYMAAKGLTDSYRLNNKMLEHQGQLHAMPHMPTSEVNALRRGLHKDLIDYFRVLKSAHTRAIEEKDALLSILDAKLSK